MNAYSVSVIRGGVPLAHVVTPGAEAWMYRDDQGEIRSIPRLRQSGKTYRLLNLARKALKDA